MRGGWPTLLLLPFVVASGACSGSGSEAPAATDGTTRAEPGVGAELGADATGDGLETPEPEPPTPSGAALLVLLEGETAPASGSDVAFGTPALPHEVDVQVRNVGDASGELIDVAWLEHEGIVLANTWADIDHGGLVLPTTLAPGEEVDFAVRYEPPPPPAPGGDYRPSVLAIRHGEGEEVRLWFTVAGRICPELNPPAWTFDEGPAGQPSEEIMCVQNCEPLGQESFHITTLALEDAGDPATPCEAFEIPQGPTLPKLVQPYDAAGSSPACFVLRYLRPETGPHACTVRVTTEPGTLLLGVDGETL